MEQGALTKEEQEIGLTLSSFNLEEYDQNILYPDEEIADELAAKWGINPFLDEYQETKSTGFYVIYYKIYYVGQSFFMIKSNYL